MASHVENYTFSLSDGSDAKLYEKANAVPIAKIVGGKMDGITVYLNEPTGDPSIIIEESDDDPDIDELECKYCHKLFESARALRRHVEHSCKGRHVTRMSKFQYLRNFQISNPSEDGKIVPLPNIVDRENVYIAGPMKCGKSFYAAEYIRNFLTIFEHKDCIIFTKIPRDLNIDKVSEEFPGRVRRFMIEGPEGDELLKNPVNVKKELRDCLVVFDDIEASSNPKMTKYMQLLRDDVMKNGRDQSERGLDTYTIVTNHQITDYQRTRDTLFEASCIVVFPRAGNHHQIRRVLDKQVGMSKEKIEWVINARSRYVAIYKRCPMHVIHETGIFMI